MKDKKWILYRHTSPSGKVYVGITSKSNPNWRWQSGKGYAACTYFYNAILKYGWNNIKHEVLFEGLNENTAKRLEIELIRHYKGLGISYNITDGGEGRKFPLSKNHKRRLSDAHRGKHLSKEWRDKIGKAHKGKIVSQETKDKMSAIMKSKHIKLSEERKRIISRSNKGKVISDKHREIVSKFFSKPVLQVDKHTGEIIREYSSMTEASKCTGIYYGSINKCCNNITKSAGGYKWRLKYDK